MIRIRVPGEKTQVVCEKCQSARSATWNYDDFTLSDGTVIKGVMIARCDTCHEQAGLASQSAYLIREARERKSKRSRTSITLSQPLRDLAELRVHSLGATSIGAVEAVVLAFVATLKRSSPRQRKRFLSMLRSAGDNPLLKGSALNVRVPLRLSKVAEKLVDEISSAEEINRSEFVRRTILVEDEDIQKSLEHYAIL